MKSAIPLVLPARRGQEHPPSLPDSRQITLVGGNGAGKSRFMAELMRLCGDRAYCLSGLKAGFPQLDVSTSPNSIDAQYRRSVMAQPYMRTDAVSEIDKLTYMLFTDEFEYLLSVKNDQISSGKKIELRPTRLDLLKQLWEELFPDNTVVRDHGRLMFATGAGSDLISVNALSQGEKTVLYYIAGVLYAPKNSVVFIDSPSLFVHPSILNSLWNSIEELRPDCTFVYDSVDEDFVSSRTRNVCLWIRSYDSESRSWDYEVLPSGSFPEDLFFDLIGGRKPVLFIEGDVRHSIDAKLYTLVFSDFTVRPLGSCDKVIETTRTFNDLKYMHHLDSHGIVDRDRRNDVEVEYLRRKQIFVPEVAEVENIFLLEDVVRIMARVRGKNPDKVFNKVKSEVVRLFRRQADDQALMHVRHKVKREVECRIDAKFQSISELDSHLRGLADQLKPHESFAEIQKDFHRFAAEEDYAAILRVFNFKPMLGESSVAHLLGYASKDDYIAGVLATLKSRSPESKALRASVKYCFGLKLDHTYADGFAPAPKPRRKHTDNAGKSGNPSGPDAAPASDFPDFPSEIFSPRPRVKRHTKPKKRRRRRDFF